MAVVLEKVDIAVIGQIIRFGGVGGVATLLHVFVAMMAREACGLAPLDANFTGFLCAVLFSYIGHTRFTFRRAVKPSDQFLRFVIAALVSLGTSSFLVWLLVSVMGIYFAIAMMAVTVVVPMMSYLMFRFWVFESARERTRPDWIGLGLAAALSLIVLAVFWGREINHDTAWYLIATRDWLAGQGLYTNISEVNPPLNFYFTLPAIGFAELFGISDTNGEYLALAVLLFVFLVWCRAIIEDSLGFSPMRGSLLLIGIGVSLVVPALNDFGQREQVLVILSMPWLLGEVSEKPASMRQQIVRAAVAALGVCLKPHFVVFPLAITVLKIVRQRSLRPILSPANLAFLAVGLTFIAFVATVHPAYLTKIVPMAREVYGAYGAPFASVFVRISFELLLVMLPAVILLVARRDKAGVAPFAFVALAGLGSYFLQGTGFSYHAIPFRAFALVACIFVILRARRVDPAVIASAVAVAGLLSFFGLRGFYHNGAARQIAHVAKEIGDVHSLMVLTPHVYAGPPAAIAINAKWVSHYSSNWLVPGALNRIAKTDCAKHPDTCTKLEAIAARNRSDNISDIARYQPELLVIDRDSGYFSTRRFPWLTFMAQDPAWSGIISQYQEIRQTDRFTYFRYMPKS
ncbi:GtrA family protein [Aliiroseovarius sp. S2029]|uniref:GtrA family protein n=1 Tax=Aliiroseovarius sp. S2029 TaxID=2936988 RepID=UPI0020BE7B73|nr:GtrA family protein [Aliiroseovarius sp. S2029]